MNYLITVIYHYGTSGSFQTSKKNTDCGYFMKYCDIFFHIAHHYSDTTGDHYHSPILEPELKLLKAFVYLF